MNCHIRLEPKFACTFRNAADVPKKTQVVLGALVEVAVAVEVADEVDGAGHKSGLAVTKLMRLWSQPQQLQTLDHQSANL